MDVRSLQESFAEQWTIVRQIEQDTMTNDWLVRDRAGKMMHLQVVNPVIATSIDPAVFVAVIDKFASLHHPHILEIMDRGEKNGYLFALRPFHEAVSLHSWLEREGVLPFLETVRILLELADVLKTVHAMGLVHGIIKKKSILWHKAHVLIKDLEFPAALASRQLDSSNDVHAFGALAYEILTGAEPEGPSVLSPVNALRIHQPPGLAHLVMRCLSQEPGQRPTTAELCKRLAVMVTPAQNYRPRYLVAQAEYMLRRGDLESLRGAHDRFLHATVLDPGLAAAQEGLSQTQAALTRHLDTMVNTLAK